ncbi:NARROW LEAF 1-like protein, partial [Tanacetum coccineum]
MSIVGVNRDVSVHHFDISTLIVLSLSALVSRYSEMCSEVTQYHGHLYYDLSIDVLWLQLTCGIERSICLARTWSLVGESYDFHVCSLISPRQRSDLQMCIEVSIGFDILRKNSSTPPNYLHSETFVRADGAFIPFSDDFDMSTVTTSVKDVGEIGDVKIIDLQSPINSLIGKKVMKVGRSSGLTKGTVLAYALEYNDEKGICFFTDFLVVGENQQTFDLEGDSGSLIVMKGENDEKPRPIGIIWGGTANRGRLKLKVGQPPENWTSGVDLGRLLNLLELDLITTSDALKDAVQEQIAASATGVGSTGGD